MGVPFVTYYNSNVIRQILLTGNKTSTQIPISILVSDPVKETANNANFSRRQLPPFRKY